MEEFVCAKLGLKPEPVSTQVVQRDRHAEFLTTIAIIGSSLEKIAIEIRHLQRTEVLEAEEFFSKGQKGSSAMPHKRNPIVSERITGIARIASKQIRSLRWRTLHFGTNVIFHTHQLNESLFRISCIALDYALRPYNKTN